MPPRNVAAQQERSVQWRSRPSETALRSILNAVADGIIVVDRQGQVRFANPASEALFGRSQDQLVGQEFGYPIAAGSTTEVDVLRGVSRSGDGPRVVTVEMRVVEAEWEGEPVLLASLRDMTGRKLAEEERAKLIREQTARAEAEAAVRARDEFLSVTAHELKTPVTRMRVAVQSALRRLERGKIDTPEQAAETLRMVNAETEHLARLVVQLLDMTRMEDGSFRLNLARADLRALIASVVRIVRSGRPVPEIDLRLPTEPVHALVDAEQFQHVVMSLLDNAMRYGGRAEPVEVELAVAMSPTGSGDTCAPSARLIVRDHGLGIPKDLRPHIFDRFFQAHSRDHVSGLGIGLYVCRQIVELHGGRIEPGFPPEGGTCFMVTIPTGLGAAGAPA